MTGFVVSEPCTLPTGAARHLSTAQGKRRSRQGRRDKAYPRGARWITGRQGRGGVLYAAGKGQKLMSRKGDSG